MKLFKFSMGAALVIGLTVFITSADHIDSPAVTNMPTDVTDFYAFQSPENSSNMVFVANLSGLMSPSATGSAQFDENVLVEFNIDNDGDNVEDLVIQAIPKDGKMYVFGPVAPSQTGTSSQIITADDPVSVDITAYGESPKVSNSGGIKVFAGPRDDPFFFDLTAYMNVLSGNAGGFSDPGTDTFAGTNVMSIVVEVPKSSLGNADTIGAWVETKIKS